MTIQIELSAETEAKLAAEAEARSMELPVYAASLLEQAVRQTVREGNGKPVEKPADRKSLVDLFLESPFRGLDLDFERSSDTGRNVDL